MDDDEDYNGLAKSRSNSMSIINFYPNKMIHIEFLMASYNNQAITIIITIIIITIFQCFAFDRRIH
mgnify:CR=1 FL=1